MIGTARPWSRLFTEAERVLETHLTGFPSGWRAAAEVSPQWVAFGRAGHARPRWKADTCCNRLSRVSGAHDKIIAAAAKRALHPLGFRRKGQSRLWLGDHGWWLAVVEFQPSGFQKGSYLNLAAHWLWSDGGYISFDLGYGTEWGSRAAEFEAYFSDEQFQPAADHLAALAAQEVQKLVQRLPSVAAAADLMIQRERASSSPPSSGS